MLHLSREGIISQITAPIKPRFYYQKRNPTALPWGRQSHSLTSNVSSPSSRRESIKFIQPKTVIRGNINLSFSLGACRCSRWRIRIRCSSTSSLHATYPLSNTPGRLPTTPSALCGESKTIIIVTFQNFSTVNHDQTISDAIRCTYGLCWTSILRSPSPPSLLAATSFSQL